MTLNWITQKTVPKCDVPAESHGLIPSIITHHPRCARVDLSELVPGLPQVAPLWSIKHTNSRYSHRAVVRSTVMGRICPSMLYGKNCVQGKPTTLPTNINIHIYSFTYPWSVIGSRAGCFRVYIYIYIYIYIYGQCKPYTSINRRRMCH